MAGESDHIVAETAARIFADLADPQTVNRAKDDALEGAALARARRGRAAARLGAGRSGRRGRRALPTALRYLAPPGATRSPVPLAETLARRLAAGARRASNAPAGAMTVAPARPRRPDHAQCRRHAERPRARRAVRARGAAYRGARRRAQRSGDRAGRDQGLPASSDGPQSRGRAVEHRDLRSRQAAAHRAAPAGFDRDRADADGLRSSAACRPPARWRRSSTLSVAYANERVAFERPIGKFQAVQQNLARLAGEVAAALAVAGSAADAIAQAETFDDAVFLEAAVRQNPLRRGRARKAPRSRIRCSAPSASPRSTSCIASRCACSPGATTSATKAIGRPSSASASRARGADEFWPLVASR